MIVTLPYVPPKIDYAAIIAANQKAAAEQKIKDEAKKKAEKERKRKEHRKKMFALVKK